MDLTPTTTTFGGVDRTWLGSDLGTNACESITLDSALFTGTWTDGNVPSGVVLARRTSDGLYGPYGRGTVQNERQTVTVTNATGGTFTLTFDGETTAAIAYDASASTVRTALEGLSNIQPGDVTCTGGPLSTGAVTVEFTGTLAATNVPAMTAAGGSLTGAGSQSVAVATSQAGSAGTVASGLEVARGLLYTAVKVSGTHPIGAALFWGPGRVIRGKLPSSNGLDAAAEAALSHIRFVG